MKITFRIGNESFTITSTDMQGGTGPIGETMSQCKTVLDILKLLALVYLMARRVSKGELIEFPISGDHVFSTEMLSRLKTTSILVADQ